MLVNLVGSGYAVDVSELCVKQSQWTSDAIISSLQRQNDVATSFLPHYDVIASCVRWDILVTWQQTITLFNVDRRCVYCYEMLFLSKKMIEQPPLSY